MIIQDNRPKSDTLEQRISSLKALLDAGAEQKPEIQTAGVAAGQAFPEKNKTLYITVNGNNNTISAEKSAAFVAKYAKAFVLALLLFAVLFFSRSFS